MSTTVTLESTLREEWLAVTSSIAAGMAHAVDKACAAGASEARTVGKFQDRTGKLRSTIVGKLESVSALGADGLIVAPQKYASYVENGTAPHEIRARRAQALHWTDARGEHFARVVQHPGTKGMPFMGPAYLKAEQALEAALHVAIAGAQKELS